MKLSMTLILLSACIVLFLKCNEAHDIGPLIKDIYDKYKTTGVTIVSERSDQSFEKTTIWYEAVRMLSSEGISSRLINFRQFEDNLRVHKKTTTRQLTVVNINTIKELRTFELIIKDLFMSHAVWLMYFPRDASRDVCEFCRSPRGRLSSPEFGSKVIISCCDSNRIEEWWRIEGNRTQRQTLGRLMDEHVGIVWSSDKLVYGRGPETEGPVLRIAVIKTEYPHWSKEKGFGGPLGELLDQLCPRMNCTATKIFWEVDPGVWDPETSNWAGVIGRVHRREVDLGCSTFIVNSERHDAVTFAAPHILSKLQLHFKRHDTPQLVWNAHFKAFTLNVWIVIIALILITPILLTLTRYKTKFNLFTLLCDHYLQVWGIFCRQDLPEFPAEKAARIIYVSLLLTAFVTSSAYSASIISTLATPSYPPFSTMEQFVGDGTYKLIITNTTPLSSVYTFTDHTLTDKLMSLLKSQESRPHTYQEAFEQVCSERVALLATAVAKRSVQKTIPCDITSIDTGKMLNLALIMPRGSKYRDLVNDIIMRLRTSGILERWRREKATAAPAHKVDLPPVNLLEIAPLLALLAGACLIAFSILLIERTVKSKLLTSLRNKRRQAILRKKPRRFNFKLTIM